MSVRRAGRAAAAPLLVVLLTAAAACRRAPREVFITYFNGEHAVSLRYPASWTTEQAAQEGVWCRYFLAPPAGPKRKPAVSVALLVGPIGGPVDEYARTYLAGNPVSSSAEEVRPGGHGRSWQFDSADRTLRQALLLLKEDPPPAGAGEAAPAPRVYGLYAQGESALFDRQREVLAEMARSLTLERPEGYPEMRDERFGFSLRLPPSWRETRHFQGSGTLLLQLTSPALAADPGGETVHASLTLAVEALPAGGTLDSFYESSREKLGDGYRLLSHNPWRDGFVDSLRAETPLSASRQRRFYAAGAGRGYCLNFEARDDVFHRIARWCDMIAGTFKIRGSR